MTKRDRPRHTRAHNHRLVRMRREGGGAAGRGREDEMRAEASIDCGWGRLIIGSTFDDPRRLAETLGAEGSDRRDVAFYVPDPQVVLAQAPQELFLDPSHAYRLDLATFRAGYRSETGFFTRRLGTRADAEAVNTLYAEHGMVSVPPDFFWSHRDARAITVLVSEDAETGRILGTVMGVDHRRAFDDPHGGASLWCLAVSRSARHPGVGKSLVTRLAELFKARGLATLDLSVLSDNSDAIRLYEKVGFRKFPAFTIKRKNPINEKLFTGAPIAEGLNPYATIIVDEAKRRGIAVTVIDAEAGLFELRYGGMRVRCRESLSELTSGVAMSICDDKRLTRRIVGAAGVAVTEHAAEDTPEARAAFLEAHGAVVVKPARGEMGNGVSVDLRTPEEVERAVAHARTFSEEVIVESYMEGRDLRLVVIDGKVVASAIRQPPTIIGDGETTARHAIEAQSRRRTAATGGESRIPLDDETERCLAAAGYALDDVVPKGQEVTIRKTANLHTGGQIVDVTAETHPKLIEAAINAAAAIDIPITGIDLIVRDPREDEYVFIEANERPGLANHEPRPTAQRMIDLLFPNSIGSASR